MDTPRAPISGRAKRVRYLFDADGQLVQRWVGEGQYDDTEMEIRRQLTRAKPGNTLPPVSAEGAAFATSGQPSYGGITPETYVGPDRREPGSLKLEGNWRSAGQFVEQRKGPGQIVIPFTAGEVNLVMQPGPSGWTAVTVLVDGQPVGDARGADVGPDSVVQVDRSGMFRLVSHASRPRHTLTLSTTEPGLRAYVFTFGP
ncbi:MAG: hypothetical protein ABIX28_03265 [Vicinamibacterales bacterium]